MYCLFLLFFVLAAIKLIIDYKKRKNWETVQGTITYSTVRPINFDTNDYITYQFFYDGILYEITEEFVYDERPLSDTEVTVYINPKNLFKSTIKPIKLAESLTKLVFVFLFVSGMIVYRLFIKRS